MTQKLTKSFQYGFAILAVLAFAYFAGVHTLIARAATLVFKTDCYSTDSATTSLRYMTNGAATTTVTCPMGNDGADTASLAIQVNASSTATVYNVFVEESMDGQDWYPVANNQSASTTNQFNLAVRAYSTFAFASSTISGVADGTGLLGASTSAQGFTATNNRNHYLIDVPVRMKRVRAYVGVTGSPGAVWMQIIPKISI